MLASAFFLEKSSVERPLKDVFAEFRLCLFLTDLLYWGGIVDAWCKFVPFEIFFIKYIDESLAIFLRAKSNHALSTVFIFVSYREKHVFTLCIIPPILSHSVLCFFAFNV